MTLDLRFLRNSAAVIAAAFASLCSVSLFQASLFPAYAETLEEALILTYQTNSRLRSSRAQLRATDELASQARAGYRPIINGLLSIEQSGGAYTAPTGADPAAALPPGSEAIFSVLGGNTGTAAKRIGVEVTQPLFQGFRTKNRIKEADAQIEAQRAQLIATEQNLFFEAIRAYLGVISRTQAVKLSQASIDLLTDQLSATQARFETGQNTRTDIALSEARRARAHAQLIGAEADLVAARLLYEKVVGQKPGTLDTLVPMPALPRSEDEAVDVALDQAADMVAARARERASALGVKVAKGALAPSIEATARYGQVFDSFVEGDETQNIVVGAQITVPLFNGGVQHSNVRRAIQINSADRYSLRVVTAAVFEAARNAWEQLRAAEAILKAAAAQSRAATLAFEGVQIENEVGQRTTLEVLNAEQELLNARLSHLEARENLYLSAFNLRRAIGALTAETLGLDVAYYDPNQNKKSVQRKWIGYGEDTPLKEVKQINKDYRASEEARLAPDRCANSPLYRSTQPCGSRFLKRN